MVFSSSRLDHITPLIRQLPWHKAPERIDYKLALLVYKCLQGRTLPTTSARRQTSRLDVVYVRPRHYLWLCAICGCRRTATELSRLPPREFGTVCHHITSAQSLKVFRSRLKPTHLFSCSFPRPYCCAREVTLVIMDTLIIAFTYLLLHCVSKKTSPTFLAITRESIDGFL